MRKILFFLLLTIMGYAQTVPQGMSHRGTAYNSSGTVLLNTSIGIRIRIFDNSNNGTFIFEEKHSATTNNNGQYNIIIGHGNSQSVPFNTIDWSLNEKFLEIGIDPSNGTNYSVLGTSQLMSVPYALYSEEAKKVSSIDMKTVSTIAELRNNDIHIDADLVYVKGYWYPGDGGGGFFSYDNINDHNDNDGTIIKPNSVTSNGRWIRQYNGFLNVRFFGVVRDWEMPSSGFSNSDQIQKMIDYASENNIYSNQKGGMTIFFPNGQYFIDKEIVLKAFVRIQGESGTLLTNHNGSYDYMFKIGEGVINKIRIENLELNLNNKIGIGGFHIKGQFPSSEPRLGGLWNGIFKNINIKN